MLELEDDPERITAGEATMQCEEPEGAMQCEEPETSSTQVKRAADELGCS